MKGIIKFGGNIMYSYNDRVSYSRIDKDGLLGVSRVVDAMQDCCLFHTEDEGTPAMELRERGRAWFVNAWHVVLKRRPAMGERFTIHTWPYKLKGIFGFRNFLMESPDHEVLAYADSRWFYMDLVNNKPAAIDQSEIDAYPIEPAYDMEYTSRKVPVPENLKEIDQIRVCENYLDTNHHLNNGQYVRLAVNELPEGYDVSEFRAEFALAARMNDILHVKTAENDGCFYVVFTTDEGKPYFISEFKSF